MSNETILVVDDNQEIANFLAKELLPDLGYQTKIAHSGKNALKMIRQQQPDLILLDFQLSDTTGLDVLRQLESEQLSVPTIIVTAHGSEQIAVDAFRLGVQDYLIKPVDPEKLDAAITRALTETRLRREKADLTAQLGQQVNWLMVLFRVGQSVTSTLKQDEVLRRIVEAGVYLTEAEEGFLALLDDQSDQLYLRAVKNLDHDFIETLRLRASDSLLGQVVSTRHPIRITQPAEGKPLKVTTGFLVHSLLHVPILSKDKVLGVLSVNNRVKQRAFSEMDETLLTSLADYAAVAIENAHLYQDLQTQLTVLQEAQTRLVQSEKLAAIGELVAGVAHELNNPLTSIIGFANILQQNDLDSQSQQDLGKILAQAQRAAGIVRGLLDFARQRPPEKKPIQINAVLNSTIELLAYELRMGNIECTTNLCPDLPLTLADPYQLQQVFVNLVNNARHAISKADHSGHLTITTEHGALTHANQPADETGSVIRIIIQDNGPGIPANVLPRIFDPFFTTKQEGQGTGLGLSVCHGIVSEHGGHLWVESETGHGTTVYVELPIVPWDSTQIAKEPNGSVRPQTAGETPAPDNGARILVVDDETDLLEFLTRIMQGEGHQVDATSDGEMALAYMAQTDYDLIICDMRLPGIGGPEIFRKVREQNSDLARRFIFITGDSVSPATHRFLEETGAPYLCKPFGPTDLIQKVNNLFEARPV